MKIVWRPKPRDNAFGWPFELDVVNEPSSIFTASTGRVEITVKLHFHHSLAVARDSDLVITISTEKSGGMRRQSNGAITLVGDAPFQGGYLGDNTCHLIIDGKLNPGP